MKTLLAVCAALMLLVTALSVFAALNTSANDLYGSLARLSIGIASFAIALLCGYGARALSYMAEQRDLLQRLVDVSAQGEE